MAQSGLALHTPAPTSINLLSIVHSMSGWPQLTLHLTMARTAGFPFLPQLWPGDGRSFKLTLWPDKRYNLVGLVQSEGSVQPTTMLWLANTVPCLLIAHPYFLLILQQGEPLFCQAQLLNCWMWNAVFGWGVNYLNNLVNNFKVNYVDNVEFYIQFR